MQRYRIFRISVKLLGGAVLLAALGLAGFVLFIWAGGESLKAHHFRKVTLPQAIDKAAHLDPDHFLTKIALDRQIDGWAPPPAVADEFHIETYAVAGSHVTVLAPQSGGSDVAIWYVHGGAYMMGMSGLEWRVPSELSRRTGATLYLPHYPLAPEASWTESLAFMEQAYVDMVRRKSPRLVLMSGISSGGGYSLALAQHMTEIGGRRPDGLVLYSPWLDLTPNETARAPFIDRDPVLSLAQLEFASKAWAGETPRDDPKISPLYGNINDLPPTLLFIGTEDILWPDAHSLYEKARQTGAPLEYVEGKKMTHLWMMSPIREAETAFSKSAQWILAVAGKDQLGSLDVK